jgi:uncharacterized membrane protein YdbT with pleckstrin-like domain
MAYIESTLTPSEEVLYRAQRHWIVLLIPVIIGVALAVLSLVLLLNGIDTGVICLIAATIVVAVAYLRWKSMELAVTNKRVIFKVGVISLSSLEIYLKKIESTGVDQGLLGGVLDYGDIVICGTGGTTEVLGDIASPMRLRIELQKQLEISQTEVSVVAQKV